MLYLGQAHEFKGNTYSYVPNCCPGIIQGFPSRCFGLMLFFFFKQSTTTLLLRADADLFGRYDTEHEPRSTVEYLFLKLAYKLEGFDGIFCSRCIRIRTFI